MSSSNPSAEKNDTSLALANIEAIRHRVNAKQMLDTPFFKYIKRNRLTKEQHKVFFCQYYTIVRTSYRMLAAGILSTPPEESETIEHLVRFLETESGGHPNHLGHYLRWAQHFGVNVSDLASTVFNKKSREFEETLMGYFASPDGLTKQAAQLGLEDSAEVLIEGLDRGYKKYPMTAKAYGYLAVHRLLENDEEGHSRWAIDSLATNPETNNRLEEIETVCRRVYAVFDGVFQGIYETWNKAARAAA
jgi:pyrroloquinoline quinone (PQQ) biosynthesis protein C